MTERMPSMKITADDLLDPRVEGYLEEQAVLSRATPDIPEQSLFAKIFYSSYFYLGLSGLIGAMAGWGCVEPFFNDRDSSQEHIAIAFFVFPTIAAGIGLFIGAAE